MRNLIFFIYKYYVFFLFLGLEIYSFVILYRYNNYQKASFLNYTANVSASFFNAVNSTTGYFNLRTLNDSLLQENARLRGQLLQSYYQNGIYSTRINDTLYKQQYEYISSSVVNNSVIKRNNYLTLDKGSNHGVQVYDGVISGNGVVGIVTQVTPHYSLVQSVLHSRNITNAKLKRTGDIGRVTWDGKNQLFANLNDVNMHVPVTVGEEVVTSNFSPVYPEGIPIGKVVSVDRKPENNFYDIRILLYTRFSKLKNVYIVRNLLKGEQLKLEEKKQEEPGK